MPDQHHFRRLSPQPRRLPLSNDQLHRLLFLLHDDPSLRDVHNVVAIIINTGLRPSELQDLLWSNVDARKSRVLIPNYKSNRYGGRYVLLEPRPCRPSKDDPRLRDTTSR
ncbi:MAG: tyrosine-type recombinase/integrase [Terracidiphilus sp.]